MPMIYSKLISFLVSTHAHILSKSGLKLKLKNNLDALKKSSSQKNKSSFESINKIINDYIAKKRTDNQPHFDELTLWEISDAKYQHNTVHFIINNDRIILGFFEDISDIIRIAKKKGAIQIFEMLLDKDRLDRLTRSFTSSEILKIASYNGCKQVFDLIFDDNKFNTLKLRIGKESFLKIACAKGARQVFNLILDKDPFEKLLKLIGKDAFFKIANNEGGRQVFNLLLTIRIEDTPLIQLGKENIIKIAVRNGSKLVLQMLSKKSTFDTLIERIGIDGLIKVAAQNGSKQILDLIMDKVSYKKLKDLIGIKWLIKLCSQRGSRQVMDLFLNKESYQTLESRFGKSGLLKACYRGGARQILDVILDKDKYEKLKARIGQEGLLKISSHEGSRQTFNLILNDKSFKALLNLLGKENIIKIASHQGANQVFTLLLDKKKFSLLENKIGKDTIVKIACHDGARQVFNIFLDKSIFDRLKNILGLETLIKISSHTGSRQVLDLFLKKECLQNLLSHIKLPYLIKIASNNGAKQVLDLILDKKKFDKILKLIGKESFIKIASHSGSRQVFNLLLNNENFETLLNHLGMEGFLSIAIHGGSSQVFTLLLNNQIYKKLSDRLGIKSLIKFSSQGGACQVFDLILNNDSYKILLDRLGEYGLKKISYHDGARQVLNLILDDSTYNLLLERLDTYGIIHIGSNNGAKQVFDLILDKDSFDILIERLDLDGFLKISNHHGSRSVLDLILNNDTYAILLEKFGKEGIINIGSINGSKSVFDIFLNPKSYSHLISRFGKENLIKLASSVSIAPVLKILLDPKKSVIIWKIFNNDSLIKLSFTTNPNRRLNNLIMNYDTLSHYFSNDSLFKYTLLHPKDQSGLEEPYLKELVQNFHFKEKEVLVLAKLSGRFIPYILDLFKHNQSEIQSLFQKNSQSLVREYDLRKESEKYSIDSNLHHLDKNGHLFIYLVEFNQYCLNDPLKLEELQYLKSQIDHHNSATSFFIYIKRILRITGVFSYAERKKLWEKLLSKPTFISSPSSYRLYRFPTSIRKWMIERGETFIQSLMSTSVLKCSQIPKNYPTQDQEFLTRYLQDSKIRKHLIETYKSDISSVNSDSFMFDITAINPTHSMISKHNDEAIHPIDWINITIKLYDLIDSKYDILEYLGEKLFSLESPNLTVHELKELKKNYPIVHYFDGYLEIKVKKDILYELMDNPIYKEIENTDIFCENPRKRRKQSPPFPASKKTLMPPIVVLNSLRNLSSPVPDLVWQSVEIHLHAVDAQLSPKIAESVRLRNADEIPDSIKDLLSNAPNIRNPKPSTPNRQLPESDFESNFLSLLDQMDCFPIESNYSLINLDTAENTLFVDDGDIDDSHNSWVIPPYDLAQLDNQMDTFTPFIKY